MVQHYFKIQFRILNRHIQATGIHPIIAWIGILILLAVFDYSLFKEKTSYAPFLILALPIILQFNLNGKKRNDFLRVTFFEKKYLLIRFIENGLIALPFLFIFITHQCYLLAIALFASSILLLFIKHNMGFRWAIPNPFFRHSFEFIQGYRQSILFIFCLYSLAIIGIYVDNFNLSCAAFVINGLIPIAFFGKLEPKYFIWNYSLDARKFLNHKTKITIRYGLIWNLPFATLLCLCYLEKSWILLLILFLLLLFLLNALLCKYAQYPKSQTLLFSLLLLFSMVVFPLMLWSIPYFYKKSIKELQPLLP